MPAIPTKRKVDTRPTALGVHIFAGGFTCGVKQAGFDVLAHFEDTDYGVASAKANWPNLRVCVGKENWSLPEVVDVDFIYSNPPCAVFSVCKVVSNAKDDQRASCASSQKVNWRTDPRTECWHRAFEVFSGLEPKVCAIESVCQAYTRGKPLIDLFTVRALQHGYSIGHVMVDGVWSGLPQSRKRFFMLMWKSQYSMLKYLQFNWNIEHVTVKEALSLVRIPGERTDDGNTVRILSQMRQGESAVKAFDRLNPLAQKNHKHIITGRPGKYRQRLVLDEPMGAFIGNLYAHPTENRFIGVNEMKALCGYPQDFAVVGRPTDVAKQLCRAVMPPVGKWLGEAVKRAIADVNPTNKQGVYFLDLRTPIGKRLTITDHYVRKGTT